jgi:hypothetical protein
LADNMISARSHSLSPQAQAWATAAALEHAIARAMKRDLDLVDLDFDRLREFQRMLGEARKPITADETRRRLAHGSVAGSLQLDRLADGIRQSPAIHEWKSKQRLGWEKKVELLEGALGEYVDAATKGTTLSRPEAPAEFGVLHEAARELVQLKTPRAGSHLV